MLGSFCVLFHPQLFHDDHFWNIMENELDNTSNKKYHYGYQMNSYTLNKMSFHKLGLFLVNIENHQSCADRMKKIHEHFWWNMNFLVS